jgi:hypothetical protein
MSCGLTFLYLSLHWVSIQNYDIKLAKYKENVLEIKRELYSMRSIFLMKRK